MDNSNNGLFNFGGSSNNSNSIESSGFSLFSMAQSFSYAISTVTNSVTNAINTNVIEPISKVVKKALDKCLKRKFDEMSGQSSVSEISSNDEENSLDSLEENEGQDTEKQILCGGIELAVQLNNTNESSEEERSTKKIKTTHDIVIEENVELQAEQQDQVEEIIEEQENLEFGFQNFDNLNDYDDVDNFFNADLDMNVENKEPEQNNDINNNDIIVEEPVYDFGIPARAYLPREAKTEKAIEKHKSKNYNTNGNRTNLYRRK